MNLMDIKQSQSAGCSTMGRSYNRTQMYDQQQQKLQRGHQISTKRLFQISLIRPSSMMGQKSKCWKLRYALNKSADNR
ncbi:hypothetical protein OXYTRIMIC_521 [Oxytricha trifallax]|uniref:Uncharacterized protein n=1 Tax=Oxytricha trifallax TaxID=1172189 RepID=A0A073HZY1_9SPIT|nr:hypothetical protein OXYTRIMIC_521 [Oxytricha trifallax]